MRICIYSSIELAIYIYIYFSKKINDIVDNVKNMIFLQVKTISCHVLSQMSTERAFKMNGVEESVDYIFMYLFFLDKL